MSSQAARTTSAVTVRKGLVSARLTSGASGLALSVEWNGAEVLDGIRLGPAVDGVDLGRDCEIVSAVASGRQEPYAMRTGKAAGRHVALHEESVVTLRDRASGRCWELVLRAAADGVAFRYRMPADQQTVQAGPESTRITVPGHVRGWFLDYQTWYETPRFGAQARDLGTGRRLGLPALLRLPAGCHLLISESAIDGRCSGAHLVAAAEQAATGSVVFAVRAADTDTRMSGGAMTPWRVLIVGDLATVAESMLVDELAPAADPGLASAGWIRPGRAAWSWWSDFQSPASLEQQQRFADYAAQQGWEHLLVDAGWDQDWVPELVSYASQRGLLVHLWSHWTALTGQEALGRLALWKSWGVAGVKIDFMESEAQQRYLWYDAVIAETARLGLMVNFHGSVIPRGWARTYPHVMSFEGIRGAEYYQIEGDPPTAAHNVIQPFTRNVAGSMDYTPVTFSAPERETSEGHELALSVAFESGITHFADEVREYAARPLAQAFLAEVAPYWDETRLLGGTPDTEAVVARRHGDRWFIGCICTGPARTIEVDLSALRGLAVFDAWLITDAAAEAAGPGLAETRITGAATGTISVPVAANGGFAGVLAPANAPLRRAVPRPRLRPPGISPGRIACSPGETVALSASPDAVLLVPPGWAAREAGAGAWQVSVPPGTAAGTVAVVTAELARPGEPSVFAHARLEVRLPSRPPAGDGGEPANG